MVYKDSAMEAFFQFFPNDEENDIYFNFEVNSFGALHAKYGNGRKDRIALTDEQIDRCHCSAQILEDHWDMYLTVPVSVLYEIFGEFEFGKGSRLSCNFYKISEDPSIEHYASYSPIISDHPNFHLPQFFEESTIES